MPEDRELDQLIDSALSTYAEPRAGLEARVLANLTAQPTRRPWLPWAISLPIAACIVLMLMLYPRHNPTEPIKQANQNLRAHTQPAPQSIIAQATQTPTHQSQPHVIAVHATHTAPKPAPLPKLDTFPGARPLSPQEQALVHFITHAPPSELQAIQQAQQEQNEPLHIAAIVIQPIKPLDESEKEK
jgi:hypothetical protein